MEKENIFESKPCYELGKLGWYLCEWDIFKNKYFKFMKQDMNDKVYILIEDHTEDEGVKDYVLYSYMEDIDEYNKKHNVVYGLDTREIKAVLELIELCKNN